MTTRRRSTGARPGRPATAQTGEDSNGTSGEYCCGDDTILVVKTSVRGTATAASLWATGAVGTAVGLEAYDVALVLSVMEAPSCRASASLALSLHSALPFASGTAEFSSKA